MEFEKIVKLIEIVSKSGLTSFTLEEEGTKLVLEAKRGAGDDVKLSQDVFAKRITTGAETQNTASYKAEGHGANNIVKSPLVGTFYSAPSPESENFVKVGDAVSKGQTLGIVEAMKLMNEIECEYDGVVKEILIENGSVVEYGQPLFVIG